MNPGKQLLFPTLFLFLFSVFSVAGSNSEETNSGNTFNIDGYQLDAEQAISGHWLGEPIMKGVQNYGINKVKTAIVFTEEDDLLKLTKNVTNSRFDTNNNVQAIHIYGEGFNNGVVNKITGYSVLVKDSKIPEGFHLETYKLKKDGSYSLFKPLSGSAVGAMDCNSVATAAVVFGGANKDLVAMTVGREHYDEKPVSESKFSSYLLNTSIDLAMSRNKDSPVFKKDIEPQMLPQDFCGKSSSCDRGDTSCNVLDGGTCND